MKNIYVLICARGGSKGIKNKNLLKLKNESLLSLAIKLGKKTKLIKDVFVSTDSKKIAREALKHKALVPFLRPTFLSNDRSPEILVWKHALNFLENKLDLKVDFLLILPVTSPLRKLIDITNVIKIALREDCDVVFTGCKSNRSPYFNMVKISKNKNINLVCKSKRNIFFRQEAPAVYDLCTVAYVVKASFLKRTNNLYKGKTRMLEIPRHRAVDIDSKFDYKIAKFLSE